MMLIPLRGKKGLGKYAKVSPQDFERLSRSKWYVDENGYACRERRGLGKGREYMHRAVLGETAEDLVVDHINKDRLDNQRTNLRVLTAVENANNRVDNVQVEAFGELQTIAEWSRDERCEVSYEVLRGRLRRGAEPELAILAAAKLDAQALGTIVAE
jgi:hypothetical protein